MNLAGCGDMTRFCEFRCLLECVRQGLMKFADLTFKVSVGLFEASFRSCTLVPVSL